MLSIREKNEILSHSCVEELMRTHVDSELVRTVSFVSVHQALSIFNVRFIAFRVPVRLKIPVFVKMSVIIVDAVCQFVTDQKANTRIIQSFQ